MNTRWYVAGARAAVDELGGDAMLKWLVICLGILSALPELAMAQTKVLYEGDSAYNHVVVREHDHERCLLFGAYADHRESCRDLTNPDRQVFEYTGMMLLGFALRPESKTIALLGLGGATIPRIVARHLPEVRLDVAEVDPMIVKLTQQYFPVEESPRLKIFTADGRQFLRRSKVKYDQILIDTFNSDYIPAHMTTKEFFDEMKNSLSSRGVIVMNVHRTNQLYLSQLATFRASYRSVLVFEGQGGNAIIIAGDEPLPTNAAVLVQQTTARNLKIPGIDLVAEAAKVVFDRRTGQAPVLTDDYAPANLLLHRHE